MRQPRKLSALAIGLRVAREITGLSRKDLAAQAGVAYSTVWLAERGTFIPRAGSLRKLATAFASHRAEYLDNETATPGKGRRFHEEGESDARPRSR